MNEKYVQEFPVVLDEFLESMRGIETIDFNLLGSEMFYTFANLHLEIELNRYENDPVKFYLYATIAGVINMHQTQKIHMNFQLLELVFTNIKDYIKNLKSESAIAYINMINTITEAQLRYCCIDDPSLNLEHFRASSPAAILGLADLQKTNYKMDERNKIMATAYLQPAEPTFGVNGLSHIEGMQNLINELIPSKIAQVNFDFIYIYRQNVNDAFTPEIKKLWEDYREGNVQLPLGLTLIDGIGKSDDEVAELVMQHLHERIMQFKVLPDHLKEIPDISFTGKVRTQLNNLFAFFSHTIDDIQSTITNKISEKNAVDVEPHSKPQQK